MLAAWVFSLLLQADPGALVLDADRPVLVRGVPFTLTVRTAPSFSGTVHLRGLRNVESAEVVRGQAVLRNVIADDVVTASGPGQTAQLERRFIPGWFGLLPPLLAILLAILSRHILLSLLAGAWFGMLIEAGVGPFTPITATVDVVDRLVRSALARPEQESTLLFILLLGGMLGVMTHSGGTRGLGEYVARQVATPRRGMVAVWASAVLFFIDDVASCLIVGSSMRPVTDRLRVAREKLAYIMDSTVAPIATIGLLSVISFAEVGLTESGGTSFDLFLHLIPYGFYAILSTVLVLLVCATGRDFGAMLAAERRAITTGAVVRVGGRPLADRDLISDADEIEDMSGRWQNAVFPVLGLIVLTVMALWIDGARSGGAGFWGALGKAQAERMVLFGILGGTIIAYACAVGRKHLTFRQAAESWVRGGKATFVPLIVMTLAWSITQVGRDLSTGPWLAQALEPGTAAHWFPMIAFLVSALLAGCVASPWTAMALLMPVVLPIQTTENVHYGMLAATLSGALFGAQISPIASSTIVASLGASSDHIDHVRTQLPYAALCAVVALACGFIPVGFGLSPWIALPVSAAVLAGVFLLLSQSRLPPEAIEIGDSGLPDEPTVT